MPCARSTRATASASVRSPCTWMRSSSTPSIPTAEGRSFSRRRSKETTVSPRSRSAFASQPPTKPRAPVTRQALTAAASPATGLGFALSRFASRRRHRLAVPDSPRRLSGGPEIVERDRVLVGVHAIPEPVVAVGAQALRLGEALKRLALEHALVVDDVEERRLT